MPASEMLRRVALVRTDVSEELSAPIIKVTRVGELGMLAITSNERKLQRNTKRERKYWNGIPD
jgi:DNA-binding TFAR19-related protein (PDSD5 family)